jgi:hypothetical protein
VRVQDQNLECDARIFDRTRHALRYYAKVENIINENKFNTPPWPWLVYGAL